METKSETTKERESVRFDTIVSFAEWNNGDVEIDPNEWFTPIFSDKVIASTGERSKIGRVVGYKGNKTGLLLGAWAVNVME